MKRQFSLSGHARTARFGIIVLLSFFGCSIKFDRSGWDQITDNGPQYVGFPGADLGKAGSYRPIVALGVQGRVTAVAGADASGRVQVISVEDRSICTALTLGDASKPDPLFPIAIEDTFAVFESRDESGRGTLHLVNAECKEPVAALPSARVVSLTERLVPPRLLVLSQDSELLAFDPATGKSSSVDQEVDVVFVTFKNVHELAANRVIVRDVALKHPRYFGRNVTELTVDIGSNDAAYVDEGGLYLVESQAESAKHLDDDVCQVRFANPHPRDDKGDSRYLAYRSPCADPVLTVYDTKKAERISVGPSPSSEAEVRSVESDEGQQPAIFHMSTESEGTILVSVAGAPAAELGSGSLANIGRGSSDGVYLWLEEPTQSRLVRWTSDGSVSDVATGVVTFESASFPERALVDDPEQGERVLLVVEGVKQPTIVSSAQPTIGRGSYKGTLFGEVDEDDVGTLRLITPPKARVEKVDERVYVRNAEFAYAGDASIYLRDYDAEAGSGELCVRANATADKYCEPGVMDFFSVKLPERGLVYIKERSGQRHLFWAPIE
ncbi:MAG: hypothetical protein JW940_33570 [Polyangiaceae bacterium]|nr:hypothetical protein [Polyangiaceae bacterium]